MSKLSEAYWNEFWYKWISVEMSIWKTMEFKTSRLPDNSPTTVRFLYILLWFLVSPCFRMIGADLAVLVVLISIGALIGKVNPLQLLIIAMLETIFFAVNESICNKFLKATDFGRSVEVHLFGALFGIAVSRMIFDRKICTSRALATSYKSEMYAMIGKSIIKNVQ